MGNNVDNNRNQFIEAAKAIGVILGVPLALFTVINNFFQQPLIVSLLVAIITAILLSAWILYSKWASLTSVLIAWLLFFILVMAVVLVWPRTMKIEGHITDAAGNPIGNEVVRLFDYSGRMYETKTDTQGYYHFLDVPIGKYIIQTGDSKLEGEAKGFLVRVVEQNIAIAIHTFAPTDTSTSPSTAHTAHLIYYDGSLMHGYDLGVNTSGGMTDWVVQKDGALCMAYPGGQNWGAVYITVGKPTDPPRPGQDLSEYKKLSMELRGEVGDEAVLIGLKDNQDPDDGTEMKVRLWGLSPAWQTFEFPLSEFNNADLHNLYVVAEFVFEDTPETICFRNIQYLP